MTSRKEILEILSEADGPMSTREIAEISYSKDPRGFFKSRMGKVFQHLNKMREEGIVDREILHYAAPANHIAYWFIRRAV